jgi:hypothetical protein
MTNRDDLCAHIPCLAARTLARAVIKQALADALDPTMSGEIRADARAFLEGDQWYRLWCEAGELQPAPLVHRRAA